MWLVFVFLLRIGYTLEKQQGILENFVLYFPFQEVISLIDTDFYSNIIYDCSLLNLSSTICEQDCEFYNNITALYHYINANNDDNIIHDALLINISSWYAMSSTAWNYYDVGNPLQCSYYYGTYCYTPITLKSDITLYQHGCCVPGSCIGDDAEKVLKNNAFCFQSFNTTIYEKVYKNNNISIFGYDLDTQLNIQCSPRSDRDFNSIGIYIIFGIFGIFIILILIGSGIRYYVGPTPTEFSLIADNMSDQDTFCAYFVSIFAIQDNFNLLLYRRNIISFEYLDGIRVLSFMWIMFVASSQIYFITGLTDFDGILPSSFIKGENVRNPQNWNQYFTKSFLSVFTGLFAIDTFFWLSGFLGILSLHKIIETRKEIDDKGCLQSICPFCRFECCKMITFSINAWIRRYLRLIPMILYVMLITAYLLDKIPIGPHVLSRDIYNKCCSNTFWQNLLLIKNFFIYKYDDTECLFGCMNHIWFVCCDFQLFLLLPIIMYIYDKFNYKIIAMITTCLLITIGIAIRLFLGFYFQFSANFIFGTNESINNGDQIYMSFNKPWSRICAYYFGALTMLIIIYIDEYFNDSSPLTQIRNQYYSKTQNWKTFALKQWQYILLQCISICIFAVILGIQYQNTMNQPNSSWNEWQNAIYYALSGPLWSFSLSLFVFALKYRPIKKNYQNIDDNNNSASTDIYDENIYLPCFMKTILSGSLYEILSKLTYTMYLIHFFILKWWSLTLSQPLYFNIFNIFNLFIATWFLCAIIALFLWLIIERPITNLIEYILIWCKNKENVYQFKVENRRRGRRKGQQKGDGQNEYLVSQKHAENYNSLEMQTNNAFNQQSL